MKKKLKTLLLLLILIPCCFLFAACSSEVYITNFYRSGDFYIVEYSDGKKEYVAADGKDGEDGKDGASLTIESLFNSLVALNYYDDTSTGFQEFLTEYLSFDLADTDLFYSYKKATNTALRSAVSIFTEWQVYNSGIKDTAIGAGAGVIYELGNDDSYIITNYHVMYNKSAYGSNKIARTTAIYLYGSNVSIYDTKTYNNGYPVYQYAGDVIFAEYVGGSFDNDVAILKVSTRDILEQNPDMRAVDIVTNYSVGETAIAVGNPQGDGVSVTNGVISIESEYITMKGADEITSITLRCLRTDAAVNGGNSGGGLFNKNGELIGIVNAKYVDEEIDNIAYALPIDRVSKLADSIISKYKQTGIISSASTLKIGVEIYSQHSYAAYDSTTGTITIKEVVTINSITQGGLAETAGLRAGDIITKIKINDTTYDIDRVFNLVDLMISVNVGDNLVFTVTRGIETIYCYINNISSGSIQNIN